MATVNATEIYLYGSIGDEVDSRGFIRELDNARHADEVTIRINSGGGSVGEGLGIYTALLKASDRGQKIVTNIDGFALSMAAVIAQAGDVRVMNTAALMMLHLPHTGSGGNAEELRKAAESLDKVGKTLRDIFVFRTRKPASVVDKWLSNETWFDCEEAIAASLADLRDTQSPRMAALCDVRCGYKVPTRYIQSIRAPIEKAVEEVEWRCRLGTRASRLAFAESQYRQAVFAMERLSKTAGVGGDDLDRCLAVTKKLKDLINNPYVPWEYD